ncbi:MAG TPA: WD40 repeat domain-containing serine/threonine protein kinase [Thermoanaerobaculia bacterium]|nr:WD40 repeat domain-containing serine/threonine protein kinase [Thermoanaerobaculia bacterium]
MTISQGTRLGPYEVLSPIGAGGMGEVYKARDTRLNRDVAIKVLPEKVAGDPEALARFEREAKAVAALSHPNVLGIFDLGREGTTAYAAMELLVGQTLRERLLEGPIPQRKALEYALQTAHGLAAAHEKGIVHRDLKPENLFVTSDGRVKILDFGLAKQMATQTEDTRSPTSIAITEPGSVMGTVGYMSPEQVRGRPVDKRSDIFSLGSILYEMLTGERAFRGDSPAEAMAAIAQKDPPELAEGSGKFPMAVERILRHCLEKRPEDRFDTAHDLAFAIETAMGVSSSPRSAAAASTSPRRKRLLGWILGAAAAAAALAAGLLLGPRFRPAEPPRFRRITYHRGYVESARFSPDERTVLFGSTRRDEPLKIYSTRLDSVESSALDLPAGATVLGISRTGEMAILLHCAHHGYWIRKGTLARVALAGGAPREILENVTDADISPDGKDLAVVREVGKRQRLEYPIGKVLFETDGWVSHPRISRDGVRVAFDEHPSYGNDDGFISIVSAGKPLTRLTAEFQGLQGLAWSGDGKEIWFSGGNEAATNGSRYQLWAVRPGGKPRLVYGPPMDVWLHDISTSGAVVFAGANSRGEIGGLLKGDSRERDLSTWSDESISSITADGSAFVGIEQSSPGAGLDPLLFFRKAEESTPVRLGTGSAIGLSPDGKWVVRGTHSGADRLTLLPTGPGEPRPLAIGPITPRIVSQEGASWSSDSRLLLVSGSEPGRPARAWLIDLAGGGPPRAVTPEGCTLTALSPDGRSIAAVDPDGKMLLFSVSGGPPREIRGTIPGDIPLAWDASGKALFVWDKTWPARVARLDIESGNREPWKELTTDPVGLLYGTVMFARDGEHYVYRVRRVLSELNVAEGLR